MGFSDEVSRETEKEDFDKYSHAEEFVIHDIDNLTEDSLLAFVPLKKVHQKRAFNKGNTNSK